MFAIRVVQAEFGDCFLLVHGEPASPRYVLVDGGPDGIYGDHLEGELTTIADDGGELELVVLSHVDKDHAVGLLDLFARLRQDQANDGQPLVAIGGLWHNSFTRALDPNSALEPRLRQAAAAPGMAQAGEAVLGIGEGVALRQAAQALGVAINDGFPNDLICADDHPAPVVLGDLTLRVVGPTQANLDDLRVKWEQWLEEHEEAVASGNPQLMANSDRSVPNLSSIMLLAEADGKTALLTGDGRSDHLLQGLRQAGLLAANGRFHVDLLKVPHHGSDRNATRTFFRTVTADTYLISANGDHGNPDLPTLTWIVEEAHAQGRQIEIVLTNETPSTQQLRQALPPASFGYQLTFLPAGEHALTVELAG